MENISNQSNPSPQPEGIDPLVTLRSLVPKPELPCYLCDKGLPLETSKRGKPYLTCNECQIQIFIRGKTGIARAYLLKEFWNKAVRPSAQVTMLTNELNKLIEERNKLNPGYFDHLFGENAELIKTQELLDKKIQLIQQEIQKLIPGGTA